MENNKTLTDTCLKEVCCSDIVELTGELTTITLNDSSTHICLSAENGEVLFLSTILKNIPEKDRKNFKRAWDNDDINEALNVLTGLPITVRNRTFILL